MKNFSRRLKKTAPLILLGLILDQSPVHRTAQALVGGPFDDNQYPGVTTDGTYSGTVSGHNLTGIVTFGVSSSQEAGGRFAIFHEGFAHYGPATGIVDIQTRRVSGTLLGVAALSGAGFATNQLLTQAGGAQTLISVPPPGVIETQGGSGTVANALGGSLTVRSGLEGSFLAQIKGYPNTIRFDGNGRLSTNANTAVVGSPVNANGAFANPNPAYTVTFPSSGSPEQQTDTTTDGTKNANLAATGGNVTDGIFQQRSILRSETPFRIRGSRTSRTVYQPIYNFTATSPITLTASTPSPVNLGGTAATPTVAPITPNP